MDGMLLHERKFQPISGQEQNNESDHDGKKMPFKIIELGNFLLGKHRGDNRGGTVNHKRPETYQHDCREQYPPVGFFHYSILFTISLN
jgi:hypothetical protein